MVQCIYILVELPSRDIILKDFMLKMKILITLKNVLIKKLLWTSKEGKGHFYEIWAHSFNATYTFFADQTYEYIL